jgi:hypothetical protein
MKDYFYVANVSCKVWQERQDTKSKATKQTDVIAGKHLALSKRAAHRLFWKRRWGRESLM